MYHFTKPYKRDKPRFVVNFGKRNAVIANVPMTKIIPCATYHVSSTTRAFIYTYTLNGEMK